METGAGTHLLNRPHQPPRHALALATLASTLQHMTPVRALRHVFRLGCPVFGVALVLSACGGKSDSVADGGNGGSDATGGTSAIMGSGGSTTSAGGGTSDAGTMNSGATGGTAAGGSDSGGTGASDAGGTLGFGKGGAGGSDAAGSAGANPCDKITCFPIPSTCKKIVQDPEACCPTCPDTGCDACPDLTCDSGTHAETTPGDCCPTCQPDPPDACTQGQAAYAELRMAMLEKYGSSSCKNSTDCAFAIESNACASTCGVVLPVSTVDFFEENTTSAAAACSSCPPPSAFPQCPAQIPACVNGMCTTARPD